jgi:hypothetical protein
MLQPQGAEGRSKEAKATPQFWSLGMLGMSTFIDFWRNKNTSLIDSGDRCEWLEMNIL